MRSLIAGSSLAILIVVAGCNHAPWLRPGGGGGGNPPPPVSSAAPTAENLVKYLNQNAGLLEAGQAINCTNLTIDINADGTKVGVSGKMLCQTPRNFLLSGVVLSSPAVEVGSNDKEFWFWSREIKPAYLYHCSYEALAQGTKVPFPFQPDMVVSALGLARYDETKRYDLKIVGEGRERRTIQLIEQARSPENKPIQKVTVFDFHQAKVPQPQVLAHILKDEQGRDICVARIRSVQQLGGNGPIIPRMIDFSWPEQKLTMSMRIENPRVMPMPPDRAARTFNRQNLNYQSFDLASQSLDGGVQRAGATGPIIRR